MIELGFIPARASGVCSARWDTIKWLAQNGVNYHELILRRDEDRRNDVIVKREILADIDRSKVLFVAEDRSGNEPRSH